MSHGNGIASTYEPAPTPTGGRPIWELVVEDMKERDQAGRQKYGTPLQAHNGRRPLVDAYQEVLDLAVYLRQEIEERRTRKQERAACEWPLWAQVAQAEGGCPAGEGGAR